MGDDLLEVERKVVLITVILLAGCASNQADSLPGGEEAGSPGAHAPPTHWPGCYTLIPEGEGWRIPEAVALDSVPLEGWDSFSARYENVFRARSFEAADIAPRDTPFAYWRPLEGDSVVVGHPGALAGITLRIGWGEGELGGTVLAFTDVLSPGQSGRDSTAVRVKGISCGSLGAGAGR